MRITRHTIITSSVGHRSVLEHDITQFGANARPNMITPVAHTIGILNPRLTPVLTSALVQITGTVRSPGSTPFKYPFEPEERLYPREIS